MTFIRTALFQVHVQTRFAVRIGHALYHENVNDSIHNRNFLADLDLDSDC